MVAPIHYNRKGSGEPLVLIHGIGHNRSAWGDVPDRLAEEFDVITIDLPGFGESRRLEKPFNATLKSSVDRLELFFEELGLDKPHVAGNSLGGAYALELAKRGKVASATAFSPAGFFQVPGYLWCGTVLFFLKFASYTPSPVAKTVLKTPVGRFAIFGSLYKHPEKLAYEHAWSDAQQMRRARGFWPVIARSYTLFRSNTPEILTNATVAWGEQDYLLLTSQAKRARRILPQSKHVSIPDTGHITMFDHPELAADIIRDTAAASKGALPQEAAVALRVAS